MPYQVTLVPNYLVSDWLHILNTNWAIWLPGIFSPFGVFLLTKFMRRIPVSVMEAAKIDGAGEWQIFYEDLYAFVQRGSLLYCDPCFYRLLEYGGTAADPVIRCGDASLVRILKQDQFRRDRTGIRRGYDLHGAQPFGISLLGKNIW